MELTTSDTVILGLAALGGVIGLFIGFSGALAFLAGLVASYFAGRFVWPMTADYLTAFWMRALAVALAVIVVFGLVRWIVRKFVHGLIAQPGDALLGALVAAVSTFLLALAGLWGLSLLYPESASFSSNLLTEVLSRVGR